MTQWIVIESVKDPSPTHRQANIRNVHFSNKVNIVCKISAIFSGLNISNCIYQVDLLK